MSSGREKINITATHRDLHSRRDISKILFLDLLCFWPCISLPSLHTNTSSSSTTTTRQCLEMTSSLLLSGRAMLSPWLLVAVPCWLKMVSSSQAQIDCFFSPKLVLGFLKKGATDLSPYFVFAPN